MHRVERALSKVIGPFVEANGKLYRWVNDATAKALANSAVKKGNQNVPPGKAVQWLAKGFTVGGKHIRAADAITTARSTLIVPTLALFSQGYTVLPASLVVANVTFDYVDGAVARYEKQQREANAASIASLDPRGKIQSSTSSKLKETWGAYYDAIADKAFAIPVWMVCFQSFPDSPVLQSALLCHVAIEGYSSYVRTRAYFRETAPSQWIPKSQANPFLKEPPIVLSNAVSGPSKTSDGVKEKKTADLSSSVVAGIVGKTKQFMSMLGTAFIMIPVTKTVGTLLVCASVPLALASVLQKDKSVVVYAEIATPTLDARAFELIQESKRLGSRLVIGLRRTTNDLAAYDEAVKMLLLHPSVDFVIDSDYLPPVGSIADASFLSKYRIDIVAVPSSSSFETVDMRQEDWKSGKIVPVRINL